MATDSAIVEVNLSYGNISEIVEKILEAKERAETEAEKKRLAEKRARLSNIIYDGLFDIIVENPEGIGEHYAQIHPSVVAGRLAGIVMKEIS